MANTIRLRRGLEADRTTITPAEGEMIYTTDTNSLYIGDGSTAGGVKFDFNLDDIDVDTITANQLDINGTVTADGLTVDTSLASFKGLKLNYSGGERAAFYANPSTGEVRLGATYAGWYSTFYANGAEAMRIDSSGNLLVGTTTNLSIAPRLAIEDDNFVVGISGTNPTGELVRFYGNSRSVAGTISHSGTSVAYNTSSDYRLKTDVQPMTGATERLKALKPVNFAWKVDGSRVDGFLAHEAQEVVPEAVTGTKDAMRTEEYEVTSAVLDDDGNVVTEAVMGTREVPDYQGIDQSKLTPLLTAALQEAIAKIEQLEDRIAALEN